MALGLLVGRFGDFVRENYEPQPPAPAPEPPMSDALHRVREACAHHVIPLALLSRTDGESAESEQKAILDHGLSVMKRAGHPPGAAEQAALAEYIATCRPVLTQLDVSLKRIEHEGAESVHRLIAAAIQVIEADGRRDPKETKFLEALSQELAKLGAN